MDYFDNAIFRDLEVGIVTFRAGNVKPPLSVYEGTCSDISLVTALLVY